jgi:hypothetical protein
MALGVRQGITIAVVDSGIALRHEDLAAHIVPGWDFVGWRVLRTRRRPLRSPTRTWSRAAGC